MADWVPGTRQGVLDMCKKWLSVFGEDAKDATGATVKQWKAWGISEERLTAFSNAYADAEAALEQAKIKGRGAGSEVTTLCEVTFKALIKEMRDMKKRTFLSPPLLETDYPRLELEEKDDVISHYGPADGVYSVEITERLERHLKFLFRLREGNPKNPANKYLVLFYQIVKPGEKAPETAAELTKPLLTKRMHDEIRFPLGSSGCTVYMAVRTGEGENGPWGAMISAVIP